MKSPNTSGYLTINGLRFHPAMIDSAFRDGSVRVNFNGNTIRLDSVFATVTIRDGSSRPGS